MQWQRGEKCLTFLIYRWVLAAFFTYSVGFSIATNVNRGVFSTYFIYLTHLNLCATMITTILGAALVTLHHLDKIDADKELSWSLKSYWALWNLSIVISFIVSAFYWMLLYKGEPVDFNNVLIHAANSVALIIDLFLCKHPAKFTNFIYPVIIEIFYLIFTIVYQFTGGLDKWVPFGLCIYNVNSWKNF